MESLYSSIVETCPLPFGGVTGSMFAGAIAALVATHCATFNDYQWPKDNADDILSKRDEPLTFDFIIVGAGTAGSLVAGRLSTTYPDSQILLVEAGEDPGIDSEIPSFLFLNQNTTIDWQYRTHPDGESCLGFIEESCIWSKGKAMGGSNAINAMIYIRGHPKDYEQWGSHQWRYEALKPYFEKNEKELHFETYDYPKNNWYDIIGNAWKELGYPTHNDSSEETITGTRQTKLIIRNGKRLNPATLYLRETGNLHIMKNTIVQKVIIEPNTKVATGIELRHSSGIVMEMQVTKEIILSAGSIATPQILMLSGIGPSKHLKELEIDCIQDLPVGMNLQDHVMMPLYMRTNLETTLSKELITTLLIQYMLTKTGPFTTIGITDYMGFYDTQNGQYPDIQFHHTFFTKNDTFMLLPYIKGLGYKNEIIDEIMKLNQLNLIFGIYPTLLHPKSRGEILLRDDTATSMPIINANYFQHPDDIKTIMNAINFVKRLETTEAYKALNISIMKLNLSNCDKNSDAYWECYARHMATTVYHPVGTVKMGPDNDKTAVVDENLNIHGVKKLRIVDASIMPTVTSGNTVAPVLAIAEKAVDIITKFYGMRDEL